MEAFHYPDEDLLVVTDHGSSLRRHCWEQYHFEVTTGPPLTEDVKGERKKRKQERMRALRLRRAVEESTAPRGTKRRPPQARRELFTCVDAKELGHFTAENSLVVYRTSRIPKAGNGLVANDELVAGDVVTRYEGQLYIEKPLILNMLSRSRHHLVQDALMSSGHQCPAEASAASSTRRPDQTSYA